MCADLGALVAERATQAAEDPGPRALAEGLVAQADGTIQVLLFFGSRRSGAHTDRFSAYDLFVLVDDYRSFYRALRRSGAVTRPALLLAAVSRLLPPSQVSFRTGPAAEELQAKCAIISARQFERETGSARRDHFCVARLFQATQLLYARDLSARQLTLRGLERAHRLTFEWVRPWLPESFDAADYTRKLLEVSLAAEIRPEPTGRSRLLWEAQSEYLLAVYPELLRELGEAGQLTSLPEGRYRLPRPISARQRLSVRTYFAWSLLRATARWAKHMLTFEGWLDYIARKATRHTGQAIQLTSRERRWPLVFLWPRVVRYLRAKNRMGK